MDALRVLLVILVLAFAGSVVSQTGERGSTPPGQSRDGAAPSDGALKGGSILPGETAGIPDKADKAKMERRCDELSGSLREDCLKQQREAATGETGLPTDIRKSSPARAD